MFHSLALLQLRDLNTNHFLQSLNLISFFESVTHLSLYSTIIGNEVTHQNLKGIFFTFTSFII